MKQRKGKKLLVDFLRRSGLEGKQLAALVGCNPMQIYHLTTGRRRAKLELAFRLQDVTRGAVPAKSWVEAA